MRIFHTLSVLLYGGIIFLIQPFHEKARKWWKGRSNFWTQLPTIPSENVIWFHCASLGEFDQGIPVMQKLKERDATVFIVVTFFSPSGMEHYHKRNHPADWVGYLPLPTPSNARRFVNHFHPKLVFFVKYEFWENYLSAAIKKKAKVYCISANFRKNQRFFGGFKSFFSPTLFLFDAIFVQNETSLKLLRSIQYPNGILAGDTRIDKVLENKKQVEKDAFVETFLEGKKAFILGSSWPIGEQLWKDYVYNHPEDKFIIAPHDISEKHITNIIDLYPHAIRYSKNKSTDSNVLIVDCIGKLSNLYQYASLAYVGGGFTGKLHNILEAVVFNIPVLIGPKHYRFPEAQQLIDKGIVAVVTTPTDLEREVDSMVQNQVVVQRQATLFFATNMNVASRIVAEINL